MIETSGKIYNTCKELVPIYRSITGRGNLKTLKILKKINPKLKILKFKSGSKVFDWEVPKVWEIYDAWVKDQNNNKIIDFKKNFLHVVGYSSRVKKIIKKKDLLKKIYTLKYQPNYVPYVTSYYKKDWGFSLSEKEKKKIKGNYFRVFINSKFKKGYLSVGEIYIPGRLKKEILLTSYICHPQMANNEISGPSVLIHLSNWIKKLKNRKFSYRILFSSETIGTISYIKKRINILKSNVIGGYVLSCVGDERCFSYIKTKEANSISDIIALKNINKLKAKKKIYSWLDRGSDERQFNSVGVNLKIGGLCRSKYSSFKEYHTSADKLDEVVTKKGLNTSYNFFKKILTDFENSIIPQSLVTCEPFLSKHKLIKTIGKKDVKYNNKKNLLNILSFSDSSRTIEDIANLVNLNVSKSKKLIAILKKKKLVTY